MGSVAFVVLTSDPVLCSVDRCGSACRFQIVPGAIGLGA
jgi:hypothetical protein